MQSVKKLAVCLVSGWGFAYFSNWHGSRDNYLGKVACEYRKLIDYRVLPIPVVARYPVDIDAIRGEKQRYERFTHRIIGAATGLNRKHNHRVPAKACGLNRGSKES